MMNFMFVCRADPSFPEHDEKEARDETWNEQLKFHSKLLKFMLGKHDNMNSI